MKDSRLSKASKEIKKLKEDNQQLRLRVKLEHQNNSVLIKNINRIRRNYF